MSSLAERKEISRQFIRWVAEQDATKPIDHDKGWRYCAVGEYTECIADRHGMTGQHREDMTSSMCDRLVKALADTHPKLYRLLNTAACNNGEGCNTYGELTEWLLHNWLVAET